MLVQWLCALLCATTCFVHSHLLPPITRHDADTIGKQIWRNECGCSIDRLVWWNEGETFASVGIGHFLWYPKESDAPFTQTFHELLSFMQQKKVTLPPWLDGTKPPCPWTQRNHVVDGTDPRLHELRAFLQTTLDLQAQFIIQRSETRCAALVQTAPRQQRALLKKRIQLITATPQGVYALIDYLNFKGDGTNERERYQGQGWGLLQVLTTMDAAQTHKSPCDAFASAAQKLLTQRVHNAPPERHEQRWLPGWLNRIHTYCSKNVVESSANAKSNN